MGLLYHDISESLAFNYYIVLSEITQKEALQSYLEDVSFFENHTHNNFRNNEKIHFWIDMCDEFSCGYCE